MRILILIFFYASQLFADAKIEASKYDVIISGVEQKDIMHLLEDHGIVGDSIPREKVDLYVQKLNETGFFFDIKHRIEGGVLFINIKQNPVIDSISVKGNKFIKDAKKHLHVKSGNVFNRGKIESDIKDFTGVYKNNGYFKASIDYKLEWKDDHRIKLIINFKEDKRARINDISFSGNEIFSDIDLVKVIQTKRYSGYQFFGSNGYNKDSLLMDEELLRQFYFSHGYADFSIIETNHNIDDDSKYVAINYELREGVKYKFGEIEIQNNDGGIDSERFREIVKFKSEDVFDHNKVNTSVDAMIEYANDKKIFIDVSPQYLQSQDGYMNVLFVISAKEKIYIDRIEFQGNKKTRDYVLRREFKISEGDVYDARAIDKSRVKIYNLGFFDNVSIDEDAVGDKVALNTKVKEQSTLSAMIGGGYEDHEGFFGKITFHEKNFRGMGQDVKFDFQKAEKTRNFDIGFNEPYVMGKPISAGINIFNKYRDQQRSSSFDEKENGLFLNTGFSLSDNLHQEAFYSYNKSDISNVAKDASHNIKDMKKSKKKSSIGYGLSYDTLDNMISPSSGYRFHIVQEYAGVGGDSKYLQSVLSYNHFFPDVVKFTKNSVLKFSASTGYISEYRGYKLNISDRFFLGPSQIRGFYYAGIGPKDADTKDVLGGSKYFASTLQLDAPLSSNESYGIRGSVFLDAANLSGIDRSGHDIIESSKFRISIGYGVSWRSQMGLMRIDFGYPISRCNFDKKKRINVSFGSISY